MSRKHTEMEYEDFDPEEYSRGRKLNKNAHRAERRARDNSRYSFDRSDDTEDRD